MIKYTCNQVIIENVTRVMNYVIINNNTGYNNKWIVFFFFDKQIGNPTVFALTKDEKDNNETCGKCIKLLMVFSNHTASIIFEYILIIYRQIKRKGVNSMFFFFFLYIFIQFAVNLNIYIHSLSL